MESVSKDLKSHKRSSSDASTISVQDEVSLNFKDGTLNYGFKMIVLIDKKSQIF